LVTIFLCKYYIHLRDLHSFPTRRSSDLVRRNNLVRRARDRSKMPGLAREEREMKHKSRALPSILACGGFLLAGARITAGAPQNSTDKFKNLEFREIGPAVMGGRIDDFAVVESDPNIVYVGTASGGVWKTTNNGTTWRSEERRVGKGGRTGEAAEQ